MTKEPTADKDSVREKKPEKTPSLLERMTQQGLEETAERARGDLRARRQLESTVLGVDPDASLEEREKARRDLAQELGLEPAEAPGSLVNRVAQRTEAEAIDRGSDEFRARQSMTEALGLEPAEAPGSLVDRVAQRTEEEAVDRGSDELRARQSMTEALGLEEPDATTSLVDRVAQRTEAEAIDRGSDDVRAHQGLTGTLGLPPDTAEPPSPKKKRTRKRRKKGKGKDGS